MSKTISCKFYCFTLAGKVSDEMLSEIAEYMKKNHFRNRSEMIRKALRCLLKSEGIEIEDIMYWDRLAQKGYNSKAELMRESIRQLIAKPASVPTQDSSNGHYGNWEEYKKVSQDKKVIKWNRLAIIPGAEELHPHSNVNMMKLKGTEHFTNLAKTQIQNEIKAILVPCSDIECTFTEQLYRG